MPFVHVRSLPFEHAFNAKRAVEKISGEIARCLDLDIQYITVTWAYLHAYHYAHGGQTHEFQGEDAPPVLVEVLVPENCKQEAREAVVRCAKSSVAAHAQVTAANVFVHVFRGDSGSLKEGTVE